MIRPHARPLKIPSSASRNSWEPSDVTRARIRVRRLDMYLRVLLDDLARRAGPRA